MRSATRLAGEPEESAARSPRMVRRRGAPHRGCSDCVPLEPPSSEDDSTVSGKGGLRPSPGWPSSTMPRCRRRACC